MASIVSFRNIILLIALFSCLETLGQGDLRVKEMVDGGELLTAELDIEFVFSGPRQQFSKKIIVVNVGENTINVRLLPGSSMEGKQFKLSGVSPGFSLAPGEEKEMEMTYLSSNNNFVTWETGFAIAGSREDGIVKFNCTARKDPTKGLDQNEVRAWNLARELHTEEAYRSFITGFPNSPLVSEANLRISTVKEDNLTGNVEATASRVRADLEKAVKANNEEAIRAFLQKHKNFPFKQGLERHIQSLEERAVFEAAAKSSDQDALRNYLKEYPEGMFTYFIKDQLNEKMVLPAKIKEGIDEIRGQLLYYIPDSMTVNEAYRVDMTIRKINSPNFRIDKGKTLLKLPLAIDKVKEKERKETSIEIGKVMRAQLIDSSPEKRFHVVPFGESEKLIDLTGKDLTLWQWDVVPLEAGRHYLNFLVEIVMTTEEGIFSEAIPVYKKKVYVEAIPGFWSENAVPIGSGAALLFGLALVVVWNKKRKTSDSFVERQAQKIESIRDRVTFYVKHNKLKLALITLDNFIRSDDELTKDVVLLKSGLAGLNKQIKEGTISKENARLETNRIRASILEIAELLNEKS